MRSYQDWEKDFRRNYRPGSPHKKNTGECYYLQFCVKTRVTSEENCSGGPDPSIEKKNISVIVRVPSMEDTILSLAPMGTEEWIINLK